MSTSTYRPNTQTRQHLEELDALIQRMLGTPLVEEPDENPPTTPLVPSRLAMTMDTVSTTSSPVTYQPSPVTPNSSSSVQSWRVEMPLPPLAETMPGPEVPWATALDSPSPPIPAVPRFKMPPVVATPNFAPPLPIAVPHPRPLVYGSAPAGEIAAPPMASLSIPQSPTVSRIPVPLTLWPIIGLNRLIEIALILLGPFGNWLKQPLGRNIVGWLGILMILGSIGWGIADWLGVDWTR